jgi:thiamine pyrophosphate-dependent acetolactate synthase large subunit-like protein
VIQISLDHRIHNGWSMDHQALPPVDLILSADPDLVVPELVAAIGKSSKPHALPSARTMSDKEPSGFTNEHIARALRKVLKDRPVTYTHLPLSWDDTWATFKHPLDYVGSDGGGGVGGGPGISIGAALALKGSGRLPVAICGDGDFLMGVTAVWTAVHYKIPLLFVLANNRSFYNDELHQERMAISPPWAAPRAPSASARSPSRPILRWPWKRRLPKSTPATSPSSMSASSRAIPRL